MRFKQKATERAVYKLLTLVSRVVTISTVLTLIYGFYLLIIGLELLNNLVENSGNVIGVAVGVIVGGLIQSYILISIIGIRDDMVDATNSDLD